MATPRKFEWSPSSSFCSPLLDKKREIFTKNDFVSHTPSNGAALNDGNSLSDDAIDKPGKDNKEKSIKDETSPIPNKAFKVIEAIPATPNTASMLPCAESKFLSPSSVSEAMLHSHHQKHLEEKEKDSDSENDTSGCNNKPMEEEKDTSKDTDENFEEQISSNDKALEIQIESLHNSLDKLKKDFQKSSPKTKSISMKKTKSTKHQRDASKERRAEHGTTSSRRKRSESNRLSQSSATEHDGEMNDCDSTSQCSKSSSVLMRTKGGDTVLVGEEEIPSGELTLHLASIAEAEAARAVEEAYSRHVQEMKQLLTNHYNIKVKYEALAVERKVADYYNNNLLHMKQQAMQKKLEDKEEQEEETAENKQNTYASFKEMSLSSYMLKQCSEIGDVVFSKLQWFQDTKHHDHCSNSADKYDRRDGGCSFLKHHFFKLISLFWLWLRDEVQQLIESTVPMFETICSPKNDQVKENLEKSSEDVLIQLKPEPRKLYCCNTFSYKGMKASLTVSCTAILVSFVLSKFMSHTQSHDKFCYSNEMEDWASQHVAWKSQQINAGRFHNSLFDTMLGVNWESSLDVQHTSNPSSTTTFTPSSHVRKFGLGHTQGLGGLGGLRGIHHQGSAIIDKKRNIHWYLSAWSTPSSIIKLTPYQSHGMLKQTNKPKEVIENEFNIFKSESYFYESTVLLHSGEWFQCGGQSLQLGFDGVLRIVKQGGVDNLSSSHVIWESTKAIAEKGKGANKNKKYTLEFIRNEDNELVVKRDKTLWRGAEIVWSISLNQKNDYPLELSSWIGLQQ